MKYFLLGFVRLAAIFSISPLCATTYYVDGVVGDDSLDGLDRRQSLRSIQEAASRAVPGDEILVAKGVYYGPIELGIKGTVDQPIKLTAESREEGAVVITSADYDLREGLERWNLVDEKLGLYQAGLNRPTCRVLYSGVDLQPYHSLDGLESFVTKEGDPGPRHGYFYDEASEKIYVRLHASGEYGSTDPNEHTMAVGPRTGGGFAGNAYNGPLFYNLGLLERGENHVIIDGFTFETPGFTGVYCNGSHVTVRHSWFLGCRSGVSGRKESSDATTTSNYITIEYCDYSQYPAFEDALELMRSAKKGSSKSLPIYWWSRKGNGAGSNMTYETGMTNLTGKGWVLRNNYIHDAFEGLSTWAVRWSMDLEIYENVFERLVDNAIESEDHASGMVVRDNLIVNVIEPLSWQPLGGKPWPGPVFIFRNVIRSDAWLNELVVNSSGWTPGWFKAGAPSGNWEAPWNDHMKGLSRDSVRAAGEGVVVFNNNVFFPLGYFLTRVQPSSRQFENFFFYNNLVLASAFGKAPDETMPVAEFMHNVWIEYIPSDEAGESSVQGSVFSGEGGIALSCVGKSCRESYEQKYFLNGSCWVGLSGSPVPQAALVYPGADSIHEIGASFDGKSWESPVVGPQW
ncbi:hypothetical protein [Puniceicoccus vermicola]|uniref:Right handed beta helix domain-containing protein n=1 Tax=Puniceicoccus vermicola TaxID=388746 RepID=A0A7X1B2W0_9BACT|nr:hypothetical protein [Puniceicoccus vermicola]MBC2603405.1 hypothetical protein [Puniceicoccus vermicola]